VKTVLPPDRRAVLSRLLPFFALALAFEARLYRLADASIWYDEGLTVWAARSRIVDMVRWTSADVHPPLYFVVMHYWRLAAGDSEFATRFPSVVFGTLAVAALWKLARLMLPKQPLVASLAAILLALSRFSVWWSQEARMYELGALLCLLNLVFAVRLGRHFRPFDVVGYLVVTAAALWTLYLLAFLLLIDGVYWLLGWPAFATWRVRLRALAGWAALEVGSVAAVAPWLAYALPRQHSWSDADATTPIEFVKLYASLLSLGISTNVDRVQLPALLIAGLAVLGALIALARRPSEFGRPSILLLLVLALPPLVLWGLIILPRSIGYVPRPQARYLLPYAGAFSLLVAWAIGVFADLLAGGSLPAGAGFGMGASAPLSPAGIVRGETSRHPSRGERVRTVGGEVRGWVVATRGALAALLFLAVAGAQVWSLADYDAGLLRTDDYISIAATLRAYARGDDAVLLDTDETWPVFAYHWARPFVGIPDGQKISPEWIRSFVGPIWAGHDATWLVVNERALQADPRHQVEDWLGSHAAATREWDFGTRRVILFARTPARAAAIADLAPGFRPPAPARPVGGDGLRLVGWEQPLTRVAAGDVLNLALDISRKGSGGAARVTLGGLGSAAAAIAPGSGVDRVPVPLLIPGAAPDGRFPLIATIGGASAVEGWIEIVPRQAPSVPATIAPRTADNVAFGAPVVARLVGHDADTALHPGQTAAVTLYWQDVAQMSASYKVFVHFLDRTNHVAAQHDDFPVGGDRPTTSWIPGEIIVDRYDVPISADLPPGRYTLEVGFYDPVTGRRLGPVVTTDGASQKDDRVVLEVAGVE
jgi:hypothetical protein